MKELDSRAPLHDAQLAELEHEAGVREQL